MVVAKSTTPPKGVNMQCIKTLLLSALLLAMFAGVGQADVFGLKKRNDALSRVRALKFGKLDKARKCDTPEQCLGGNVTPGHAKDAQNRPYVSPCAPGKGLLKVA